MKQMFFVLLLLTPTSVHSADGLQDSATTNQSKLVMPRVFGDHMALQADAELPVWGMAAAKSEVKVTLGNERLVTTADQQGKWHVKFPARPASHQPTRMTIQSGKERLVFTDVLIGEVWLCAGQSNMEWPVSRSSNAKSALANSNDNNMRLLHLIPGARGSSGQYGEAELDRLDSPRKFFTGRWQTSTEKSAADFSAVAWYFGKKIRDDRNVPVGLICNAVGGTPTEAWIPRSVMADIPQLRGLVSGNWLNNPLLGQFCRDRGKFNLKPAMSDGLKVPGDYLGPNHSFKPGFLWSAGIEPLVPFAVRGVIWYQGESNAETPQRIEQHGHLLPLLIKEWRDRWGQARLPFGIVQLPAMDREHWPLFRDQQRRIASRVEDVGMVVTVDTGHPTNVHPPLKKPVGERLAQWAVACINQQDSQPDNSGSAPVVVTKRQGKSLLVELNGLAEPLTTKNGPRISHFELAGSDQQFCAAEAKIASSNQVIVRSPRIDAPQFCRYAWRPFLLPAGQLWSGTMPVSPFTTQSEDQLRQQQTSADENKRFATSFEDGEPGPFTQRTESANDAAVSLQATGTVSINTQFARTGKRCLHMLGDENNSLVISLPKSLQSVGGIQFHAERWTRRNPFTFAIDIRQNREEWRELANLNSTRVGARFLTEVQLAFPPGPVTRIRLRTKAAPKSGLLIDDLALLKNAPKEQKPKPVQIPTKQLKLLDSQPLFASGTNDTHTFRIPAIITAKNGDLIAACDARRKNAADLIHQREIDIVYRRSRDNGKTWSPMQIMDTVENGGCSDPSLLLDRETGEIFCFYNFMVSDKSNKEFRFYVQSSRDHGRTWSQPKDFTDQVADKPELKLAFKFVTSGRGIQLADGTLMHNFVRVGNGGTVFASKNHGKSWHAVSDYWPADESKLVQLKDGSLMINSRRAVGQRYEHRSTDGGKTWTTKPFGPTDPRCNAAILRYTFGGNDLLLFCNAASPSGRKNLAVRTSRDNGQSWSDGRVIDSGPSAYSELTVLKDGTVGVLYEPGHQEVRFVRFELKALSD